MDQKSIDWKDFEISVELHKSYLDFALKLNLFYYGITGAILSFHFSKESPTASLIGLLLPTMLSILLGLFFLYGAKLAWNLRTNIIMRAQKLELMVYPEGIVLVIICAIFGVTMLSTGAVLLGYLLWN